MELVVYAPVFGQSGFEVLSRGLLLALDQMGVQVELRPAGEWNSEKIRLPADVEARLNRMIDTRVSPLAPHVIYQLPKAQPITRTAPSICYTLFETDRVPAPWVQALLTMNRILVFSEFNRKAWSESGIPPEKIAALPPAVDSFLYNPEGPKMSIPNAKGFVFLTSGDFTERKNFEAVLEAYVKEFNEADPVTLVVKGHYGGFVKRYRRDCLNRLRAIANQFNPKNPPRILFWGDKISYEAMAALYRTADCFVLTSRGEGLGLQYLEAMASGVPIIHADWSAHTDYLNQSNSYPVAAYLKIIDDPNYIVKCPQALNSRWCQVEISDLRRAMRHVVDSPGEAKEKAARALEWVRGQTWHNMAVAFVSQVINMFSPAAAEKKEELQEVAA